MSTYGNYWYYDGRTDYTWQKDTGYAWNHETHFTRITQLSGEFSYRFETHFHPYVPQLLSRLLSATAEAPAQPGIPNLQAEDTRYRYDGENWVIRSGSARIQIASGTNVILAADATATQTTDDSTLNLAAGDTVSLLYAARAQLPNGTRGTYDGTTASLIGPMVPNSRATYRTSGSDIPYKAKVTLESATTVELPKGTLVVVGGSGAALADDTPVTLAAAMEVEHLGGLPQPELYDGGFFDAEYDPQDLVDPRYPVKELDFSSGGAYSVYNWELFYHAPFAIAVHLSRNQRFAEAQRWFHLVFDPTDDGPGPAPERFWKVRAFQFTEARRMEDIVVNLSTGADPELRSQTIDSINAWLKTPFRPHVVARYRHGAYMVKTVMAYLDNLIAWGDSLFRQDTRESINEATQLYVLAANILGPRPQAVPKKGSLRLSCYEDLSERSFSQLNNVLVQLESDIPFDTVPDTGMAGDADVLRLLRQAADLVPYFCLPRNDRLMSYWDTVAQRLYNIRHSLNIRGIFRQLPLWEPPIDPAMLARAAAAGLDIGAIVSGASQPLPLVRFQFLVQKASEICQEVKSLGSALLAAMEKEDNETLSILRARHEAVILGMIEMVRYAQWQDAIKAKEGLQITLDNAKARYVHYERLLGEEEGDVRARIPEQDELDVTALEKLKLRSTEIAVAPREIGIQISPDAEDVTGGEAKSLSRHEVEELEHLDDAQASQSDAANMDMLSSFLGLIPDFSTDGKPMGVGAGLVVGGKLFSRFFGMVASSMRAEAGRSSHEAGRAARIGSHARREQEWAFQSNLAAGEITQTFKQLRAAEIRTALAERELKSHQAQIQHAKQIEDFLTNERTGKKTNQGFYAWMKRESMGLHAQCFQLAFDVARKAERALQHELGDAGLSYLQFNYLAGKQGLLAGEKLHLDLRRMEVAYQDLNQREYELTKHLSLMQLDPYQLMQLRTTGSCTMFLPEELFDLDCPGHYFRRIKSVALSIPCVSGPYSSVNCRLTLQRAAIRKNTLLPDGVYERSGADDPRFDDSLGAIQSVVTSAAQNDSGMFEVNLRDERYLPFEGCGVLSEWQLQLPGEPGAERLQQFDYDTIADVVLHLRYTAREGGALLQKGAVDTLNARIAQTAAPGCVRLFSVRHEFPVEWAKFHSVEIDPDADTPVLTAALTLTIRPAHFPYWSKGMNKNIEAVDFFAQTREDVTVATNPDGTANPARLVDAPTYGNVRSASLPAAAVTLIRNGFDQDTGEYGFTLYLDKNNFDGEDVIEDLWLGVRWGEAS